MTDLLEIGYECPKCYDQRFYVPDLRPGEPGFGRAIACDCAQNDRIIQFLNQSGLTEAEKALRMDYEPTVRSYPKAVNSAAQLLRQRGGMMLLFGTHGTGKSGLAKALVAHSCRSGHRAMYKNAYDILGAIKDAYHADTDSQAVVNRFKTVPVLVVDEFEKANPTTWARERFHDVIDFRYRKRSELITLIVTNLLPTTRNGIDRFLDLSDEYSLSWLDDRLKDAYRVGMVGKSLRGSND